MTTSRTPSPWRTQALSAWSDTRDPQFYGVFDVDVERAGRIAAAASSRYRRRIGLHHLVVKAVATTLADQPALNQTVRWGRGVPHEGVPLALLTYLPGSGAGEAELHKYVIADAHLKDLGEIAREDLAALLRIHRRRDPVRERRMRFLGGVPPAAMGLVLRTLDFLTAGCQVDLTALGFPRVTQGAGIINNLMHFPLDGIGACLLPTSRAPFLLALPAPTERPASHDGRLALRPILRLCGTFDNRLVDGYAACRFGLEVKRLLEAPESLLEASPAPAPAPAAAVAGRPREGAVR
jgi:hypothetical protein